VAERGTFDELLAAGGRFSDMWHRQQNDDEEEA
jgi:ABC-type multidrug transport system fused ATPase/permease subunit